MARILIIEDNMKNRILEKDLLEAAGFEVLEAVGPEYGMIVAKNKKPDLIIMDVRLPGMRGTEAARMLREDKAMTDVPIVFVTASVLQDGMTDMGEVPNSGYIPKPINTRTFVKEIKKFLKRK